MKLDKSKWKPVTFGEVVRESRETVKDPQAEGLDRVVGLEHIETECIHLRNWAPLEEGTTFTKCFHKGQVLFGRRRAYLKKAALAEFDGICSGDITVMEAKEDLLPELLPFLVGNDKFFDHAVKHSAGGLSPRVKFKDLASYEFLLPPKDQQAKLAELLWAGDAAMESIHRLKTYSEVLFKVSEEKCFEQHEKIKENLLDIAKVQRGKFSHRPRNEPRFYGGDIPFIQTGEVVNSQKFIRDFSQTLNEEGLKISKMFPKGTIVMTIAANIGFVGILDFDSAFTDSLVGIHANKSKIDQEYLFYYLKFKQPVLDSLAPESAQKNLSIDSMSAFHVYYPKDRDEQKRTVKKLDHILETVNSTNFKLQMNLRFQRALINQIF